MEKQSVQEFEFPKAEVTDSSSRVAFFADDSHSDVGLFDHADIVSSISNCQHCRAHICPDKLDNFSFFFGGGPTEDNWPCLQQYFFVYLHIGWLFLLDHVTDLLPFYQNGHLIIGLQLDQQFLAFRSEIDSISSQPHHFKTALDKLCQISYILSSLHLVTSYHHNHNACPLQTFDSLRNILLQPILDPWSSDDGQIALYFFDNVG